VTSFDLIVLLAALWIVMNVILLAGIYSRLGELLKGEVQMADAAADLAAVLTEFQATEAESHAAVEAILQKLVDSATGGAVPADAVEAAIAQIRAGLADQRTESAKMAAAGASTPA
jgi:hypothetical protein